MLNVTIMYYVSGVYVSVKTLESLSLADSKLKVDTGVIINALGGNTQLTELDIRSARRLTSQC